MSTMIYAPAVSVRIWSTRDQTMIDVSDDLIRGSVTRVSGGVSSASFSVLNRSRKYEGMFSPMDRVVIYMRRIRAMVVFTGYLDEVPLWSATPDSASYRASCSLKRLQHFYWDPGSPAATNLFLRSSLTNAGLNDGGLAKRTVDLLDQVVGWDKDKIHIGAVPSDWFSAVSKIAEEAVSEAELSRMALQIGNDSYIGGSAPLENSYNTIEGIGPGTGILPQTFGRVSYFGGPGGGAYGNMALTGESGVNPRDDWYCAMRWPYVGENLEKLPNVDVAAAKAWWTDRRIMVVAEKTGKAVILRAADWGPNVNTGKVLDVSPVALKALGIVTGDVVKIAFAEAEGKTAPLGVVDTTLPAAGPTVPVPAGGGNPGGISSGWGAPGDASNMVGVSAAGIPFSVHRIAADKFVGFVTDLKNILGYQPKSIGGYNPRKIAGSSRWSNHAYGAAIDIDPSTNPVTGPSGGSYTLPKPPQIIQLARKWGLGWGGEWNSLKDYMHFEVIGSPSASTYGPAPVGATVVSRTATKGTQVTTPKSSEARASGGRDVNPDTGEVSNQVPANLQMWVPPLVGDWHISTHFGEKGSSWKSGYHTGTDFSDYKSGSRIRPVGPGVIHASGYDGSYGNHVSVDHGKGVYTFYAHMENPTPRANGEAVDPATSTLGTVGTTGNTAGAHLHIELRLDADTYDAGAASGGIEKYIQGVGTSPPPRGVDGSGATIADVQGVTGGSADASAGGAGVTDLTTIGGGLLNVYAWAQQTPSELGILLTGYRALMNDEPIMNTIGQYMKAGFRDYCSAPNGDFIAWYPDYFGHYGQAGKMIISDLEIDLMNSPSITWSDTHLKTHMFVTGSTTGYQDDSSSAFKMIGTAGIASVENVKLLRALLNFTAEEAEAVSKTMLSRYGARPEKESMSAISSDFAEFYFACMKFMENWAAQWNTTINTTFLPEMFPGMLAVFPSYGLQGYVREVTHNFDFDSGFTTTISAAPWSTLGDNGPSGMPKGAPL